MTLLVEETVLTLLSQLETPPQLSPLGVAGLPIATTAIFYLATFMALIWWLQLKSRSNNPAQLHQISTLAYMLTLLALTGCLLLFPILSPYKATSDWLAAGSLLLSLGLGGLTFAIGLTAERRIGEATGPLSRLKHIFQILSQAERMFVIGVVISIISWLVTLFWPRQFFTPFSCVSLLIILAAVLITIQRIKERLKESRSTKSLILFGQVKLQRPSILGWRDVIQSIISAIFIILPPILTGIGLYIVNIVYMVITPLPVLGRYPGSLYSNLPPPEFKYTLTSFGQGLYVSHVQVVLWGVLITIIMVGLIFLGTGFFHFIRQSGPKVIPHA